MCIGTCAIFTTVDSVIKLFFKLTTVNYNILIIATNMARYVFIGYTASTFFKIQVNQFQSFAMTINSCCQQE